MTGHRIAIVRGFMWVSAGVMTLSTVLLLVGVGIVWKSCLAGQKVSLLKSKIFCSMNVSTRLANTINRKAGIPFTKNLGKNLGVNILHERVRKKTCKEVTNKGCSTGWWVEIEASLQGREDYFNAIESAGYSFIHHAKLEDANEFFYTRL